MASKDSRRGKVVVGGLVFGTLTMLVMMRVASHTPLRRDPTSLGK